MTADNREAAVSSAVIDRLLQCGAIIFLHLEVVTADFLDIPAVVTALS
jgi:hypothetical protein